ncbi:MAG TPA: hypothetical protein VK427_23715 [Kofleriaceae bacterium]|nr:hypothetical protein [Kofleriaceae bacterium]
MIKLMATNKTGKLTPTAVVSAELVRLEPIPSPPASKAVSIVSVEVTGTNPQNGKTVTGNVIPQANGDLAVPRPGQPNISITVTTSDGPRRSLM